MFVFRKSEIIILQFQIIKPSINWGPKDSKKYDKWKDFKQSKEISRMCAKKSKVIATLFGNN